MAAGPAGCKSGGAGAGAWLERTGTFQGGKGMMLKGRTALITGSTSGIGLGYAKALAAEGANIVINGFGDADAIEAERAGLESISGAREIYRPGDLTRGGAIGEMKQKAGKRLRGGRWEGGRGERGGGVRWRSLWG